MSFFRKKGSASFRSSLKDILAETKWIYRHTRAYRRYVIAYVFLGLAATALSMLAALLSRELVNSIVNLGEEGWGGTRVAVSGISVVAVALVNILLSAFVSRFSTRINLRISNELRAEVYGMFMNTDWQSLQEFHSGDLLNRINTDVNTVAGSVLGWLPSLIIKGVSFAASLSIILIYDPTMALFALISAPVTFLVARPFVGKMRKYNSEMRTISSEMTSFHEESLQNAQSIKAFNLVDTFLTKLEKVQQVYYDKALDYNRFTILNSSFLSTVGMLVSYLCFGWAAYRVWLHKIDIGTMVLFIQLAGYLSSSLTALIRLVPSAIDCTVAAQRIMTIFDLPRENTEDREAVEALKQSGVPLTLELKDLRFSYQSRSMVLKDLQFRVEPHEMVAIVGPSGSGKTTLFRILLGLVDPDSGTARVTGGEESFPLSPSTRSLFSYVPQDNVIFSGTIADTLRLVRPEASDEDLHAALRVACAEDFVCRLPDGIHTSLKEGGGTLSVGQNQRLAIARAVLADAPILLLDEITSALDLETEKQVLENISALRNKTCIISTHRPSVLSLCSKVYRIEEAHLEPISPEEALKMTQEVAAE